MSGQQKVSFTVRRPTPISRATSSGPESDSSFKVPSLPRHLLQSAESPPSGSPLARSEANSPYTNSHSDSSDEDDTTQDELVTGFDKFGVQRCVNFFSRFLQSFQLTEVAIYDTGVRRLQEDRKKKKEGPLVIPALKNKDWRELARKRRSAQQNVHVFAKVHTGADGSVGGLGTKDVIGAGPILSGLQLGKHVKAEVDEGAVTNEEDAKMEELDLSEDEVARRAILAEANGGLTSIPPIIDTIPTLMSEGDAYKQDVDELPEVASLEDYARVPVEQFGAAMLRGMGWKEGTAASKNGEGLAQPYLPMARPALLGIGAKEMEVFDDGSKKKKSSSRPEKRYVPVIKRERDRGDTPGSGRERSRSPNRSRRSSVSADRNKEHSDHRRDDYDHQREEKERAKDKYREQDRNRHRSERNGDRHKKDRQQDHDRSHHDRGERSKDFNRRKDY